MASSSPSPPPQSPANMSPQALPVAPTNNGNGNSNGGANGRSVAKPTPSVHDDAMDVDGETATAAPVSPESQASQSRPALLPVRTPEPPSTTPLPPRQMENGGGTASQAAAAVAAPPPSPPSPSPPSRSSTPGHIPPFDWEAFEARYERALTDLDGEEAELLREFEQLVTYFNVWASAASAHDDERAVKRLQTRERYVRIAEQTLNQRKQHLTEVVRAFQSALALLSQT